MNIISNDLLNRQQEIRKKWLALIGNFPTRRPAFAPRIIVTEKQEQYDRIKIALSADADYPDDIIYAWLLVPHRLKGKSPAMLCLHPTTFGCGKDIVVDNSETYMKNAPENIRALPQEFFCGRAYAKHLAELGYVVMAPDIYSDGERVEPDRRPYEPVNFYQRYPEWSVVGKAIWDNMLAVDYLCSLDYVDSNNIGVIGHSLGGHSAVFAAGFDDRLKAVVTNGGCTVFRKYLEHWSRLPLPPELAKDRPPVYCYIPKFRNYMANASIPNPVSFADIMNLICPRNLLYSGATSNSGHEGGLEVMQETWDGIFNFYQQAGVPENVHYHIYPGNHGFPDRARNYVYRWLDEKLKGTKRITQ
jgi:hypothetical protein